MERKGCVCEVSVQLRILATLSAAQISPSHNPHELHYLAS